MFAGLGVDVLRLGNNYQAATNDIASTGEVVSQGTQSLGRKPVLLMASWTPPAALKVSGATKCGGNPDTCTLREKCERRLRLRWLRRLLEGVSG